MEIVLWGNHARRRYNHGCMDHLFTPWRFQYINTAAGTPETNCLFCELQRAKDAAAALIIHRAEYCFVVLNRFPYTNGHLMIAPYAHLDELRKLATANANEMMALAQHAEDVLRRVYKPNGLNIGMNLGRAAGAGVAGHIHLHVLPRWVGDSNFMTSVGETRVLPESLEQTYERVRSAW